MIVKYTKERGYKGAGQDPSLTLGAKYIVFGMNIRSDGRPNTVSVLCDDEQYPVIFDISFFDVVDPNVPDGWCFLQLTEDIYRLCPKEFTGDFWDRFHDGEKRAEAVFDKVVKKMEAFHS